MKSIILAALVTIAMILGMKPEPPKTHALPRIPTVKTVAKAKEASAPIPAAAPVPAASPQAVPIYTGHELLMHEAGIADSDFGAVDYIVSHESSWSPDATEPATGAHGLVQALPYSKTGCTWDDAICQLKWGSAYATSRYGSWWGAYNFWSYNRWW